MKWSIALLLGADLFCRVWAPTNINPGQKSYHDGQDLLPSRFDLSLVSKGGEVDPAGIALRGTSSASGTANRHQNWHEPVELDLEDLDYKTIIRDIFATPKERAIKPGSAFHEDQMMTIKAKWESQIFSNEKKLKNFQAEMLQISW